MRQLGIRQKGCLEALKDFGQWNDRYSRWQWGTPSVTQGILDGLVKRGLVLRTTENDTTTYKLSEDGRKELGDE